MVNVKVAHYPLWEILKLLEDWTFEQVYRLRSKDGIGRELLDSAAETEKYYCYCLCYMPMIQAHLHAVLNFLNAGRLNMDETL